MIVPRRNLAFLATMVGLLESGLVVVVWWANDYHQWQGVPPLLRAAAPVPYLMGEPGAWPAFALAWTLNTALWACVAYVILAFVFRKHLKQAKAS
jgi:hypothetical protein